MRWTEVLQEIRKMRFEEIYRVRTEKRLTVVQEADMLGIDERTFRRWLCLLISWQQIGHVMK